MIGFLALLICSFPLPSQDSISKIDVVELSVPEVYRSFSIDEARTKTVEIHFTGLVLRDDSGATNHAVITSVFDPITRLFWWSWFSADRNGPRAPSPDRFRHSHRIHLDSERVTVFRLEYPFLFIKESQHRVDNIEQGLKLVISALREKRNLLSTNSAKSARLIDEKTEFPKSAVEPDLHSVNLLGHVPQEVFLRGSSDSTLPRPRGFEITPRHPEGWVISLFGPASQTAKLLLDRNFLISDVEVE